MVFSSTAFLYIFLPAFLGFYVLVPQRNLVVLFFSLLFFTWGEGYYVLLLLGTVAFNYAVGQRLDGKPTTRSLLALGITINLFVLGYYKYFGFLVTEVMGIPRPEESLPHLPLGISFFIFQSISYLIDVQRGHADKARSVTDLALYITMFPQLIAGPIVRYNTVAKAIISREVTLVDVYQGLLLFICGLSYKVLIANNVAMIADNIYSLPLADINTVNAWVGTAAYTLQIYFDFAGYSLMAIGIGRLLGFHFPQNFNYPYCSKSITEFWRRWHMSLSSWFRDYLYIPLGGNRSGPWRTYFNLAAVFVLCGIWHGAAWTFLLWGLFHGSLLVVERAGLKGLLEVLPTPLRRLYLIVMVMIGWVLFRAESLEQATTVMGAMFTLIDGGEFNSLVNNEAMFFAIIGTLLSFPLFNPARDWLLDSGEQNITRKIAGVAMFACLLLLCTMYIMAGTYNPFIYFRF